MQRYMIFLNINEKIINKEIRILYKNYELKIIPL